MNAPNASGALVDRTLTNIPTLLPMPDFRKCLEGLIETDGQFVFTAAEQRALKDVARSRADEGDGRLTLLAATWQRDNKLVEVLRQSLTRLATYLLTARNSLDEPSD
jgi:hypothetical protein